jgi:hypothetical protein
MDDASFGVFWSAMAREAAKQYASQASTLGIAKRFLQILKDLLTLLATQPTTFGEPQWQRGNVEDRLGILDFVAVQYRVDISARVVLVVRCTVLSGHGFEE